LFNILRVYLLESARNFNKVLNTAMVMLSSCLHLKNEQMLLIYCWYL